MIAKFKEHIDTKFSFLENSKIVVAISGGIDSVVLTHLLHSLGFQIALAHVNFQLRGAESDTDESFVKALGQDLNIPVFTHTTNTKAYADEHKLSIQMAARDLRYEWFKRLLKEQTSDYILTGHHLDDTIETFFINLNRSTGLDGLTGIPAVNHKIIRPLLPFSRDELVVYANQNNLTWREDTSNTSTKYLRNSIRHNLLPVLTDIEPNFREAFSKSQAYLKESQALVNDYILLLKPKIWIEDKDLVLLSLKALNRVPNNKAVLHELLKDYGFTQWDDVYNLIMAQTGKQVFSATHFLLKDREYLKLGVIVKEVHNTKKQVVGAEFKIQNSKYKIEMTSVQEVDFEKNNVEYIDKSKINYPLFVRKWQEGDYFYPLGMQGKKKLSDFLIDQKVSRVEKEKIWLLCDAQDQIIWIIDKRLDNRFKITEKSTEILKITTKNE